MIKLCPAYNPPASTVKVNPLAGVEGIGKRKHGKPQLRIDEARRWEAKALELAGNGEEGAVAALMALYLNLRASEIVRRVVRDIDDGGRVIWIDDSKTPAGKRTMEIPEVLRAHLVRLIEGKLPDQRVFSATSRDWPRHWVQRICKLVGVPVVCAHGVRGTHSSLARAFGSTGHAIAQAMGHTSEKVTLQSYTDPAVVASVEQQQVLRVLQGGRAA